MTSLRRRLTLSYTVLVGLIIAVVAGVLTWIVFDVMVRPIGDAITVAANTARSIAANEPGITADALARRVRNLNARPDIVVNVLRGPGGPPFGRGFPPPGFRPNGFPPPGDRPGPPPDDRAGPPPRRDAPPLLESFSGIRPQFVRVGRAQIAILPNRTLLTERVRTFLVCLAAGFVLALVFAWLIARWLAAQAAAPLEAVTAELERFAGGDFTPNAVPLHRFSDVAPLIAAYNGAAEQVSAAFAERTRAEERMRRFLGDAGHELRTPLSIVIAYIDVLRKGGVDDASVRATAFATLGTETVRMRRLVDRLVALARLEQPETLAPVRVDVGALADDVITAITAARPGEVRCEAESGAFALADPAELHEAIANLVDNALKYGGGSAVRVAVEHERDAIAIRVCDGGPGIPPEDREKIFERFYRANAQYDVEGSGLGLAIAARAAARAGGTLALASGEPGNTVFVLRLPQIREPEMRYTR